ncbi:cullin-4A [Trichonephila clavipes]|nr:cullin-4A [Trichonephila clavipes]
MHVCKYIVPSQNGGTINSRKSSREGGGKGRELEALGILPQKWGETELNCSVTCMVLKATANDRRHLALCHNEFRGPLNPAFADKVAPVTITTNSLKRMGTLGDS